MQKKLIFFSIESRNMTSVSPWYFMVSTFGNNKVRTQIELKNSFFLLQRPGKIIIVLSKTVVNLAIIFGFEKEA